MILYRNIGGNNIAVEITKQNEVYLPQELLDKIDSDSDLTEKSLVKVLAKKNKFIPLLVRWELLDKCTLHCPFCYIVGHSEEKTIRFNQMKPFLTELIEMGMIYCILTGGEPTLHPDFKELYTFLKNNGCLVEVHTNATLIDSSIFQMFNELKPFKIEISIYGLKNDIFNHNTNNTNKKINSNRVVDNIIKLKNQGHNVVCKTPLNTYTISDFNEIVDLCKAQDISFYSSNTIFNAYDGKNLQQYKVENTDKLNYDFTESAKDLYDCGENTERKCFPCSSIDYSLSINSAFEITPCSGFKLPECQFKIIENGAKKAIIERNRFIKKFRNREIDGCESCIHNLECSICSVFAKPRYSNKGEIISFYRCENYCKKTEIKNL